MKRPAPAPARSVVSSSPGRPEKLPAPGLGRLLRGKSGSRSRGRSSSAPRSSPMFISRSRSAGPTTGAAAAEGDPSSPKVSCIGQVRIRSKKKAKAGAGAASKLVGSKKIISMEYKQQTILPTLRCRCLTRLCKIWPESRPAGDSRSRWNVSRWFKRKSRSYRQRESGVASGNGFPPPATAPRCSISDFDVEEVEESEEQEEETRVFMPSATSTPPKNALLLMRCRSAPHNRSSALATSRFAITPVEPEPEPELELELVEEQARIKCRDDAGVSCNQNSGDVKEEADTLPVVLTRCKSEPARTAAAKLAVSEDDVVSFCSSGSGRRLVEERRPAATAAPPASPSLKPI